MNQQFRYGENDIFLKTLKTLARFSPGGYFLIIYFDHWSLIQPSIWSLI